MTFAKQIEEILGKRHEQANILAGVIEKWKSLKKELETLEKERSKHISNIADVNSKSYLRLQEIDLSAWINKISKKIEELENLKKRLSRGTVNIGVVGRMRQGKSKLLQSLTGLTDAQIPTSADGVCTRILSKIFHEPNTARNEVEFHSPASLLEIIHLYYDTLGLPANSKPQSLEDFKSIKEESFPRLPHEIVIKNPSAKYLYGILRGNYYSNYEEYKQLLTGGIEAVSQTDITNYVTRNQQVNNSKPNSKYLAVKELRIFCKFPDGDEVGKIGVVDLPGLGDDDVSDAELLIKTLKQDIDFILFVRRPDPKGDNWQESDRKMYGLAKNALNEFPIEECSFLVLNKDKDEPVKSEKDCKRFKDEIQSQGLRVANVVIANCTNPIDVKKEVLTPVLENLTKNIGRVYEQYLRSHNQELILFRNEIMQKLDKAVQAMEGYKISGDKGFNYWFEDEIWTKLRDKILQKNDEFSDDKDKTHTEFEQKIHQVVQHCLNGNIVPETTKIRELRARFGASYKIAYYMCINEVKANLTREFKSLAKALEESERKLQLSVAKILYDEGKFAEHSLFQKHQFHLQEETCVDFFEQVEKLLPNPTHEDNEIKKLEQAFRAIKQCTSTYGDTIISWIQPHLDTLKPDQHLDPISKEQCFATESDVMSERVNKLQETVSNLSEEQVNEFDTKIQEIKDDIQSELLEKIAEVISSTISLPFPLSQILIKNILSLCLAKAYPMLEKLIVKPTNPSATNSISTSENKLSSEELIRLEVDTLRKQVVEDCQRTLERKLNFPNTEAYTKFDRFFANALAFEKAETVWRDFYQDEKNQELWPGSQFKRNALQIEQDWQKLVNDAIYANNDDGLLLPQG